MVLSALAVTRWDLYLHNATGHQEVFSVAGRASPGLAVADLSPLTPSLPGFSTISKFRDFSGLH